MRANTRHRVIPILFLAAVSASAGAEVMLPAVDLVRAAFEHYRGAASFGSMRMTIHRPGWERTQEMDAWTRGDKDAVVIITAPVRDRGNGTLKRGDQMWTFNPRINRVIKLPPSLMSQAWMGSDFSYHDLARSDTILVDYTHEIVERIQDGGHTVYRVRLTPRPDAPVVWGTEELLIRDDFVVLEERYFDQDGRLVKTLVATEIEMLGGRLLPRVSTMVQADDPERFTRVEYLALEFRDAMPDRYFTEAFLRNPRD